MKKYFLLSILLCFVVYPFTEAFSQSLGKKSQSIEDMAFVYVERNPLPVPTTTESQKGFIVYPCHSLKMSFEHSRPGSTRLSKIEAFAAQGELIPITFCVYALRNIEDVRLEFSDLKHKDGFKIPAKYMSQHIVQYLNKRFMYQKPQHLVNAPAYMASLDSPVLISADRSEKFWINFRSPEDAKPGIYKGTITVHTRDAMQKIPLNIRILPFQLPEPKGLLYGMYYSDYRQVFGSLNTVDAMRAQVRNDLTNMRDHGMTSIGLCNGVSPSSYTVTEDGEVKFDFKGNTLFELIMEAYKENKFTEPVIDMSKAGQVAAAKRYEFGTVEYDSVYVRFYKKLAEEAKSKDWPVMYIQPFDEPGWHSQQERDDNLHLLKVLNAAGIPTEINGPGDDYFVTLAGPYSDLWNYNAALSSVQDVRKAQAEGRKVTLYNYDVSGWLSECSRWACGLYNWKFGLDGTFNWVYFGGRSDLYNDLDGFDWMHYYPKTDVHPGGSSIGFEGIRQGVNDRHYLELCQQVINDAKIQGGAAADAAMNAEKMLNDLRENLSDNLAAQYKKMDWTMFLSEDEANQYVFIPPAKGKILAYVSGEYKYSNNLQLEDYDKIRWMVAAHIVNILEKSKKITPTGITLPAPVKISKKIPVPEFAQKTITIPTLKNAPVVDGKISLDEWKDAGEINLTLDDVFGELQMPTKVYCGINDDNFYVAFICTEEVIDYLTINATKNGGKITSDDCVEIYIDPGITQSSFYHIAVNPHGFYLTDGSYKDWDPDIKTAATINGEKQEWIVEIGIPVGDLNLVPQFGLNFNRERRPKDALLELSSWAMTGGSFGRPERFGTAVIKN